MVEYATFNSFVLGSNPSISTLLRKNNVRFYSSSSFTAAIITINDQEYSIRSKRLINILMSLYNYKVVNNRVYFMLDRQQQYGLRLSLAGGNKDKIITLLGKKYQISLDI